MLRDLHSGVRTEKLNLRLVDSRVRHLENELRQLRIEQGQPIVEHQPIELTDQMKRDAKEMAATRRYELRPPLVRQRRAAKARMGIAALALMTPIVALYDDATLAVRRLRDDLNARNDKTTSSSSSSSSSSTTSTTSTTTSESSTILPPEDAAASAKPTENEK